MTEQMPTSGETRVFEHGLRVAREWGALGAEGLEVALKAMDAQLVREHGITVLKLKGAQRDAELAAAKAKEDADRRLAVTRLVVGCVMGLVMMGTGIAVATYAWWLSVLLCGPSLLALVHVLVLGRSDAGALRYITGASRQATDAAAAAHPPPAPPAA
ncbi:hypothetical protein [Streptomyces albidoflavus]|uniref:hypothetical protein n=1 Tax=Streptomyces albidoflavus TaxID=1886 RepID=UPI002F90EC46|nr:hypothetical protein OHA76_00655 [Streptomyces albidoflavus]WSD57002.1 hypothetical protein OHA76_31545 [Streptomyces albidoflavus]WTE00967.1 hypothetical protein OG950_31420 [Streptomyces albidoflavus]